jgi:hypothetical protein
MASPAIKPTLCGFQSVSQSLVVLLKDFILLSHPNAALDGALSGFGPFHGFHLPTVALSLKLLAH